MTDKHNHPEEFLDADGRCRACACVKSLTATLTGNTNDGTAPKSDEKPRSESRIKFAEKWITRFMDVLDTVVDEETRNRIMQANGRSCFLHWLQEDGPKIEPMTLKQYAAKAQERNDGAVQVEDNVIFFQFMSAAETGQPSEENACLCPFVETKPEGLSGTYCQCSVGYVKQWHELVLERPVTVDLIDSVLMGGPRCRFKIAVS